MLVILALGTIAIVATALGLFLSTRGAKVSGGSKVTSRARPMSPKERELVELFTARLRSGAIGVPDLIRLLRKEGRDPREIHQALVEAMSRFSHLAGRRDKLEAWFKEAEKEV